ncbi:MAG: hypothetical protein AB1632_14220 [Nitrospirota bacterium]
MKAKLTLILILLLLSFSNLCLANTGVFYGAGNQVIPIKNDQIQLVKENVSIKLTVDEENGRFGVPFIPWANVIAKFHLKNITQYQVTLQIGFPFLDLQGFGDEKYVLDNLNFTVVSNGTNIPAELKEGLIEKELDPKGLFKKVFSWQDTFTAGEAKEVIVTYKMLMGVASANSIFRDYNEQERKFRAIDKLFPALSYSFTYITKTAYTWAGDIEESIFQLDCRALYDNLEKHNVLADPEQEDPGYTRPLFWESAFPDSGEKNDGVYKWVFKKKVPEDGLYYSTTVLSIPALPPELATYYSKSISRLSNVSPEEFKSILVAYYQFLSSGEEPSAPFQQKYFEKVRIVKIPKTFIFEQDKEAIENISSNFNKIIK